MRRAVAGRNSRLEPVGDAAFGPSQQPVPGHPALWWSVAEKPEEEERPHNNAAHRYQRYFQMFGITRDGNRGARDGPTHHHETGGQPGNRLVALVMLLTERH